MSTATANLMKVTDLAVNVTDVRERFLEDLIGAVFELRRANNNLADVQAQYANPAHTRGVISQWLSELGVPHELDTVFYSADLSLDGGITGGQLLNRFATVVARQLWEVAPPRNVDYVYRTLSSFPVPAFGSKPTGLGGLQNAISGGSFVGAITVAYETHGPGLAIFTATTGTVVWFSKPLAQFVRQATKNWLANKLGVTKIEE